MGFDELFGQSARLPAEHQKDRGGVGDLGIGEGRLGGEIVDLGARVLRGEVREVFVVGDVQLMPVVQARALQLAVVDGKAERFDEMKRRAGCGAGARDVAGILWDLGFEQDDFSVFDELILRDDAAFRFTVRSRRPPLDNVNALLSFAYSLLANECAAALEGVGLDPSVGMLHTDRPGRKSLALDLMEELRPLLADRFVLTGINNRVFASAHFDKSDSGAVSLNDAGRRAFLTAWKKRRDETITHPFLGEKR